jgi:hypothetical protein
MSTGPSWTEIDGISQAFAPEDGRLIGFVLRTPDDHGASETWWNVPYTPRFRIEKKFSAVLV